MSEHIMLLIYFFNQLCRNHSYLCISKTSQLARCGPWAIISQPLKLKLFLNFGVYEDQVRSLLKMQFFPGLFPQIYQVRGEASGICISVKHSTKLSFARWHVQSSLIKDTISQSIVWNHQPQNYSRSFWMQYHQITMIIAS